MPAFQPAPESDGYYYPSGLLELAPGVYDPGDLDEDPDGSNLYKFEVGDYAYPALTPVPHIEMTIFTLDPATVTITVYRTVKGRTMPVRGQIDVYAGGGRNVVDWQAPFGVPLTYRAEQFDIDGNSLGYTSAFSTQLDVAETWVQNPFDPVNAVQVTMASDAATTLPRPTPGDTYRPAGSGLAVTIYGQRQGLTDAPCSFFTNTEDDADKVRNMLGDPYTSPSTIPVLVIRTGTNQARMRFPQPFIASIVAVETPLNAQNGGDLIRWDATGTETPDPAPSLVAAVLTYADFDATYSTYAAEDAAYSSYLELDRDYTLTGAAETETP